MLLKKKFKVFPWTEDVHRKLTGCFGLENRDTLQDALRCLLESANSELSRLLKKSKTERAKKLLCVVEDYVLHLHVQNILQKEELDICKYSYLKLLSCLLDLYIFLSQGDPSSVYLKYACRDVFLYTGNDVVNMWDGLLHCTLLKKRHSELCYILLRRVLNVPADQSLQPKQYMKFILLMRLWKVFSPSKVEKGRIIAIASKVEVPNDFMEFLSLFPLPELPSIPNDLEKEEIAQYLICKKFPKNMLYEMKQIVCDETHGSYSDVTVPSPPVLCYGNNEAGALDKSCNLSEQENSTAYISFQNDRLKTEGVISLNTDHEQLKESTLKVPEKVRLFFDQNKYLSFQAHGGLDPSSSHNLSTGENSESQDVCNKEQKKRRNKGKNRVAVNESSVTESEAKIPIPEDVGENCSEHDDGTVGNSQQPCRDNEDFQEMSKSTDLGSSSPEKSVYYIQKRRRKHAAKIGKISSDSISLEGENKNDDNAGDNLNGHENIQYHCKQNDYLVDSNNTANIEHEDKSEKNHKNDINDAFSLRIESSFGDKSDKSFSADELDISSVPTRDRRSLELQFTAARSTESNLHIDITSTPKMQLHEPCNADDQISSSLKGEQTKGSPKKKLSPEAANRCKTWLNDCKAVASEKEAPAAVNEVLETALEKNGHLSGGDPKGVSDVIVVPLLSPVHKEFDGKLPVAIKPNLLCGSVLVSSSEDIAENESKLPDEGDKKKRHKQCDQDPHTNDQGPERQSFSHPTHVDTADSGDTYEGLFNSCSFHEQNDDNIELKGSLLLEAEKETSQKRKKASLNLITNTHKRSLSPGLLCSQKKKLKQSIVKKRPHSTGEPCVPADLMAIEKPLHAKNQFGSSIFNEEANFLNDLIFPGTGLALLDIKMHTDVKIETNNLSRTKRKSVSPQVTKFSHKNILPDSHEADAFTEKHVNNNHTTDERHTDTNDCEDNQSSDVIKNPLDLAVSDEYNLSESVPTNTINSPVSSIVNLQGHIDKTHIVPNTAEHGPQKDLPGPSGESNKICDKAKRAEIKNANLSKLKWRCPTEFYTSDSEFHTPETSDCEMSEAATQSSPEPSCSSSKNGFILPSKKPSKKCASRRNDETSVHTKCVKHRSRSGKSLSKQLHENSKRLSLNKSLSPTSAEMHKTRDPVKSAAVNPQVPSACSVRLTSIVVKAGKAQNSSPKRQSTIQLPSAKNTRQNTSKVGLQRMDASMATVTRSVRKALQGDKGLSSVPDPLTKSPKKTPPTRRGYNLRTRTKKKV